MKYVVLVLDIHEDVEAVHGLFDSNAKAIDWAMDNVGNYVVQELLDTTPVPSQCWRHEVQLGIWDGASVAEVSLHIEDCLSSVGVGEAIMIDVTSVGEGEATALLDLPKSISAEVFSIVSMDLVSTSQLY